MLLLQKKTKNPFFDCFFLVEPQGRTCKESWNSAFRKKITFKFKKCFFIISFMGR